MVSKPKAPVQPARHASSTASPVDPYLPGDALPVPEVIEKNTDSVWALWSDAMEGRSDKDPGMEPRDGKDQETQPATLLMGLPEMPKDPEA